MFDRESRPTITELVAESADSSTESADFTTDSARNLARIGVWVRAFTFTSCRTIYQLSTVIIIFPLVIIGNVVIRVLLFLFILSTFLFL